jgi:hypothetical protein
LVCVKILDSRVGFLCCFILLHALYLFDKKPVLGSHICYLVYVFIYWFLQLQSQTVQHHLYDNKGIMN